MTFSNFSFISDNIISYFLATSTVASFPLSVSTSLKKTVFILSTVSRAFSTFSIFPVIQVISNKTPIIPIINSPLFFYKLIIQFYYDSYCHLLFFIKMIF
jgi:hypothetical protein